MSHCALPVIAPIPKRGAQAKRPDWLRVKVRPNPAYNNLKTMLGGLNLNTVCEEARCPNIWECWGEHRTATFMILGDICTRLSPLPIGPGSFRGTALKI